MKIKMYKRKYHGKLVWWVVLPGPIPDIHRYKHYADALARIQFEVDQRKVYR